MATGDKKRAVMTDDINNSGSPYPVMPLKTIDQTPTAGNTDHLISSAGVKSAIDAVTEQIGSKFKLCARFNNGSTASKTYTYDLNTAPSDLFVLIVYQYNYVTDAWGLFLIQRGSDSSGGSTSYKTIVNSAHASITLTAPRTLELTMSRSYMNGVLYSL